MQYGQVASKPHIKLLPENNVRTGFFEPDNFASVLANLPEELQPVITFAYITGWRIASEVLPLEWRQIDFDAGEIRLDAGTTKNGDGRVFPISTGLRKLLLAQNDERKRLAKSGHIVARVFFRMVADGRGGGTATQANH